ncbi:MAG TPA: DUF3604 domain-containing protein [Myxococcota bacterium]|nr:DUF3604 domain-containing protein [Myxococcota bacterium]
MSVAPRRAARAAALLLVCCACSGGDAPDGAIEGAARQAESAASGDQILFGDLHVHTTWSIDAFLYGLPLFGGEGAHPPADACDFARHCAGLDFYSLNDHAEGLTPERWRRSIESVRACNEKAGDPSDPDLVAFVGWEWSQMGETPETHFGHKNVIVRGLADDEVPARPISALADDAMGRARLLWAARMAEAALALPPTQGYADFLWWIRRLAAVPFCPQGVDTRDLPDDCHEQAPTPERLFEKLRQWGGDALVIPHGLAWGVHAPPSATLAVQLAQARRAPELQRLVEVYSGHGNSEVYERAIATAQMQELAGVCPAPTPDFLPCCWQAGEILRKRCGGLPAAECESRVAEVRRLALEAGKQPHWVLPDAGAEEWLDCDQPRDGAFKPVLAPRPDMSAQAALALGDPAAPDADGRPSRFHWGFVASSDTHSARAGSGYKQVGRKGMSDARGLAADGIGARIQPYVAGSQDDPARGVPSPPAPAGFRNLLDVERGASFLYPGGLAAVHAHGRGRDAIWEALVRREVYGTSGPRILLWFDLVNAPRGQRAPMGSEVALAQVPRFEVRAVGSRVELPGCSEESRAALSPERLARICMNECHNPGDTRHAIAAIEVVRVHPQSGPGEPLAALIEDPWLRIECKPDPNGCAATFEDPDFAISGRDAVYYVRALQEATPAVNGANLRTRYDEDGNAIAVEPCYGDARTPDGDDCLAPVQERAWSSPIFVNQAG